MKERKRKVAHDFSPFAFTFDDFSLVPQHSTIRSRKDPDTSTYLGKIRLKIPIIAAPMNTVSEHAMGHTLLKHGADAVIHRYMSIKDQVEEAKKSAFGPGLTIKPFCAVGASGDYLERAGALWHDGGVTKFCVDVANGHSQTCVEAVQKLRENFPHAQIMAGNVCTYEGSARLAEAGANIIRCGVGSGSVCSTRLITGFGVPQLTAINWCTRAAEEYDISIVADGGIRSSGDIVKALAAGADAVMIGGLLAGTSQSPGETRRGANGQLYKMYHGMASTEGRESYFNKESSMFVPEGVSTRVPFKGDALKIIDDIVGGLKVGMSFADAPNLQELRENVEWVRITDNGRREANPNRKLHGV